jgi:O-antigen/teichoic acid export membrane protein
MPEWCIAKMYPAQVQYHGLAPELRVFVASSIVTMVNIAIIALFNGMHRSRRAMVGQLCGAFASLVVTIPLTMHYGLRGILFGTLASNSVIAIVLLVLSRLLHRDQTAAELREVTAG